MDIWIEYPHIQSVTFELEFWYLNRVFTHFEVVMLQWPIEFAIYSMTSQLVHSFSTFKVFTHVVLLLRVRYIEITHRSSLRYTAPHLEYSHTWIPWYRNNPLSSWPHDAEIKGTHTFFYFKGIHTHWVRDVKITHWFRDVPTRHPNIHRCGAVYHKLNRWVTSI